jgi:hypothetical protein
MDPLPHDRERKGLVVLKIVVSTVKNMHVRTTECSPECSIQTLNEVRKGMNVTGKHVEERGLVASTIGLEKIVALEETIIGCANCIGLGDRMTESAEEAGECQLYGCHLIRVKGMTVLGVAF